MIHKLKHIPTVMLEERELAALECLCKINCDDINCIDCPLRFRMAGNFVYSRLLRRGLSQNEEDFNNG